MTSDSTHRGVRLERIAGTSYVATNDRGGQISIGVVTFRVRFPDGEQGEQARALLPDAVQKSHDRLCTVSRTIELGTPIANRIE